MKIKSESIHPWFYFSLHRRSGVSRSCTKLWFFSWISLFLFMFTMSTRVLKQLRNEILRIARNYICNMFSRVHSRFSQYLPRNGKEKVCETDREKFESRNCSLLIVFQTNENRKSKDHLFSSIISEIFEIILVFSPDFYSKSEEYTELKISKVHSGKMRSILSWEIIGIVPIILTIKMFQLIKYRFAVY